MMVMFDSPLTLISSCSRCRSYKFDKTKKVDNSDVGGAVFYKFDYNVDRGKLTSEWE